MRGRLLVALIAVVVMVPSGCSGRSGQSTPEAPAVSATPWSAPFEAHLNEYLDPEWTSQPIVGPHRCWRPADGDLEGYINGKLIVVSADTGQLLLPRSLWWDPSNDVPVEPGPPDWGLPWANTPEEVGTVVIVWATKDEVGRYWDDSKGYREDWGVKLVDFEKKAVVGDGYFHGSQPSYTKSGSGDVTGVPPWVDLMAALRARLFAAPFDAHLSEYLDPAWMSQPTEWSSLEGYIKGKLVVVSADTGQLLRPTYSETRSAGSSYGPVEPGPPEWGLPWADTPEEVGTVVIVWPIQAQEFTYTGGAAAYREDFMVKLVDFETKTVVGEGAFLGESLPTAKSCPGDLIGQSPWADLMDALRAMPRQAEAASTPGPSATRADTATTSLPRAVVTTDALNVRAGPGTNYPKTGVVRKGVQMVVTGRTEAGDWLAVTLADGKKGWVAASLVKLDVPVASLPVVD